MVMEMIETEPPFFNEPPLMAMKKIRDGDPPTLKDSSKVKPFQSMLKYFRIELPANNYQICLFLLSTHYITPYKDQV